MEDFRFDGKKSSKKSRPIIGADDYNPLDEFLENVESSLSEDDLPIKTNTRQSGH